MKDKVQNIKSYSQLFQIQEEEEKIGHLQKKKSQELIIKQ
jgi:hypothetical protein